MKSLFGRVFIVLAFSFTMYYFALNDMNVFSVAIGVLISTIGFSSFMFSITAYRLKNYNFMTRFSPSGLVATIYVLLHDLSYSWTGTIFVNQIASINYFLILTAYTVSLGLLIGYLYTGKKYDHKILIFRVFGIGIVLGLLVLMPFWHTILESFLFLRINLAINVIILMYTHLQVVRTRKTDEKDIVFLRAISGFFALSFIIAGINSSDTVFFTYHMFLLFSFLLVAVHTIRRNINDTLMERYNHLAVEIDRLDENNENLRQSERIFRSLYEDAPIGYQSMDINGNFLFVNNAYADKIGYSISELLGKPFTSIMTEESAKRMPEIFKSFKAKGEVDQIFEMVKKNGKTFHARFIGKIAREASGDFRQTHCIMIDVSNELEYQNELKENMAKISSVLESTSEGIAVFDLNGKCNFINAKGLTLLGRSREETIGHTIHTLFHSEKDVCLSGCILMQMAADKANETVTPEKIWRKDGSWFMAELSYYPQEKDGEVLGKVFTFRDVTSKQELSKSLMKMSYHDYLTGLYNRRYFEKELVVLDKSENYPLTIVNTDINGLKLINDAFGHAAGDELLIRAAEVLSDNVGPSDLVARIGGDEFVIIMPKTSAELAEQKINNILDIAKKVTVNFIELSISVGYATKTSYEEDIQSIYKQAEDAMYRMKLLKLPSMRSSAINTVLSTLYEKDTYSEIHSRRVSEISASIAKVMNLPSPEVQLVQTAGLLHDIGKIVIPTDILVKEGKLTEEEYEIVQKHSEIGYRILNSTDDMTEIAKIVLSHHEWVDGLGYPRGIKGDEIPLLSRIICVADAFDAMTSERTYRKTLTDAEALKELKRCAGTQFDATIVQAFEEHFDTIRKGKK